MSRPVCLALVVALWMQPAAADVVCRVVSSAGVAFGNYDLLASSPTDSLMNITVACDRDGGPQFVSVEMGIGTGLHGTSVSARRMQLSGSLADYLTYGLFSDVSRSAVWGTTTGLDTVVKALEVPNKGSASTTFTIYGRIPARQDVPAGIYGDSLQVTVQP